MKKAKTRKNIFSILSAFLGVVFAFITGVTFCVTELNLTYGKNPKSTTAYMDNQQYHIINDTLDQQIVFGEGSRNFDIAIQYSIPFNFDVRFKYSLVWSNGASSSNVILHFANRDNVIYDNEYIYLGDSITKGDGKITFITGVDFVNTQDSLYYGQTLKINITEVKIYKQQSTYSLANHVLTKDIQTSIAAQTWINYKNRATSASNHVVMYNTRNTYANGVPYPGLNTAYKKPTVTETISNTDGSTAEITKVSGPTWLGGNKAYAGTGMYVIAGSTDLKFSIEVAGIWRLKTVTETGDEIEDVTVPLISENSIKFNYSSEWSHASWDDLKLWETRNFDYTIKAGTACYIDILDSIEVTSASRVVTNMYDSYRAVINLITINPNMVDGNSKPLTSFQYSEMSLDSIQMKTFSTNASVTTKAEYKKSNFTLINTSEYSGGLYTAQIGKDAREQIFRTNISLINNTNTTQKVKVDFNLMYYIGNGNTTFTNSSGNRAEEVYATPKEAFKSNLYYAYSLDPMVSVSIDENDPSKKSATTASIASVVVTLAPYASVSVKESYSVPANLQAIVKSIFGSDYDVWTYLIAKASTYTGSETIGDSLSSSETSEGYTLQKTNLVIETKLSSSTLSLIVKNNSTKTIKGVYITGFSIQEMSNATYQAETTEPSDWAATYWQYYYLKGSDYIQYTTNPINDTNDKYPTGVYKKAQDFISLATSVTAASGFTKGVLGDTYTNANVVLKPGDAIVFGTVLTSATKDIYVAGNVYTNKAATPSTIMLINSGKTNAFMINYSENAYYVRFSGALSDAQTNFVTVSGDYNYYIGIVRPGQIIPISMSGAGTLYETLIEDSGIYSESTLSSWNSTAREYMAKYFALVK